MLISGTQVVQFLSLVALSAVGTFVPAVPEGVSVTYIKELGWNIWLVALGGALGQSIAFIALYYFGEQLMRRWQWLARQVYEVRTKFADHLEERFLVLTGLGGLFGVPPAVAMAALGSGFGVPSLHLIPVLFVSRVLRFAVLTAVWGRVWDWVRSLF